MNSKELQDVFQSQLKQAEKSKSLNEQAPVPRPSRKLEDERFQWQMHSLQMEMQKERNSELMEIRTTIVTGESHTCKLPFDQLRPIHLKDMQVPKVHEGRYLVCQVVGIPVSMISINTLVQDLNGDPEILHIYNYSYDIQDTKWLSLGQILVIKEPCLRFGSYDQTASLRVDSPSDLIFVDPTNREFFKKIGAERWYVSMSDNAEEIKASGNQYFQNKDYESATFLYDRAIRCAPDMAVLYLNKASSQLRSGYFDNAYESAKTGLEKGGDREKALFRMGLAAYGKRDWKLAVDHFQTVHTEFPKNKDVGVELDKANARLAESQTGKYDIKTMYNQSKNGKLEFDVADYVGPIEVTEVPGKNKGVVATKDIKKGTLLSVSKAFATGYQKDYRGYLMAVNLIRNHADGAANKLQMIRVIEKLRKNPSKSKEVYALFAGKLPRDETIPEGVIGVARIEQISVYNRFGTMTPGQKQLVGSMTDDKCSLYLFPSYYNHACLANAKKICMGDVMFIYALKDLKKGDEVTLHYISPLIEYSERFRSLDRTWGFTCHCRLCEADASDGNCSKRVRVFKQLDDFGQRNMNYPRRVIDKGKPILEQMRGLYNKRTELKIDLALTLCTMACVYAQLKDYQTAIKYFEEMLPLVDEELELEIGLPNTLINLSNCYLNVGQTAKAKEMTKRAFKMSLCVDLEQFRIVYPSAVNVADEMFQ